MWTNFARALLILLAAALSRDMLCWVGTRFTRRLFLPRRTAQACTWTFERQVAAAETTVVNSSKSVEFRLSPATEAYRSEGTCSKGDSFDTLNSKRRDSFDNFRKPSLGINKMHARDLAEENLITLVFLVAILRNPEIYYKDYNTCIDAP